MDQVTQGSEVTKPWANYISSCWKFPPVYVSKNYFKSLADTGQSYGRCELWLTKVWIQLWHDTWWWWWWQLVIATGIWVPVSIPVTRVPVIYPGTQVALITYLYFLNCEISKSLVFMNHLCLHKLNTFSTVASYTWLSLPAMFYRRACLLMTHDEWFFGGSGLKVYF